MKQQLQKQMEHDRTSICIMLNLIRQSLTLKSVNSQSQNPTKPMYPTDLLHRTARNRQEQLPPRSQPMIKIVPSTCVGTLFTTCFYTLFPNHIAPKMFQSSEVKSSKSWQYVLHSTSQMSSIVALQEEKTGELLGRTAWCHEATDPLTLTGPK